MVEVRHFGWRVAINHLGRIHTVSLLERLSAARARGDDYRVSELKAELATREHVPNKTEARALRQQAATNARGRNKGRQR